MKVPTIADGRTNDIEKVEANEPKSVRSRSMDVFPGVRKRAERNFFFDYILKKWCVILNELRRGYGKTSSRKKKLSLLKSVSTFGRKFIGSFVVSSCCKTYSGYSRSII